MTSLLKKKKEDNAPKCISDIAKRIRGEGDDNSINVIGDQNNAEEAGGKTDNTVSSNGDSSNSGNSDNSDLAALLESIKNKDYNCKEVLYVDADVKEIFSLLKAKAKVPISSLVSFILEDWLFKHSDDISTLIQQKKNRFL